MLNVSIGGFAAWSHTKLKLHDMRYVRESLPTVSDHGSRSSFAIARAAHLLRGSTRSDERDDASTSVGADRAL